VTGEENPELVEPALLLELEVEEEEET